MDVMKNEPVYISYPFADMFVRTEPTKDARKFFVKFKGKSEFESDPEKNNQLMDAILEGKEITKKEYESA